MSGTRLSRSDWMPLLLVAAVLAAGACDNDNTDGGAGIASEGQSCPPAANVGVPAPDDAQVVAVLMAANQGEILTSQVVQGTADRQEVRNFADRMIKEHTDASQRLQALMQQQGLTANESPLSQQLEAEAFQIVEILNTLEGEQRDRAYMEAQINLHAKVLFLMDSVLLPQATDAALRQELVAARALVQSHLEAALPIQVSLVPRP